MKTKKLDEVRVISIVEEVPYDWKIQPACAVGFDCGFAGVVRKSGNWPRCRSGSFGIYRNVGSAGAGE
jgi:hypothetical protein